MTLVIELVEGLGNIAYLLEDAGVVTPDGWQSLTVMGTELVELDPLGSQASRACL